MSVEQQRGLRIRTILVRSCILIIVIVYGATVSLGWNSFELELYLILLLPGVFGLLPFILKREIHWLNYGLPLINLLAIVMWLICFFIYEMVTVFEKIELHEYAYLAPLTMISVVMILLIDYVAYLLKELGLDYGSEDTQNIFSRGSLDKLLFGCDKTKIDYLFCAPHIILFSSFSLFISTAILFGFSISFNDLHLRSNDSLGVGLHINPVSVGTPNIQGDSVYVQIGERNQELYEHVQDYVNALYDLVKAQQHNNKNSSSGQQKIARIDELDSLSDTENESNYLNKVRQILVESITYQSFPRNVIEEKNEDLKNDIFLKIREQIKQVDNAFSALYEVDPNILNINQGVFRKALFQAVNNEGPEQVKFSELLSLIVDHFVVVNSRRELSDENKVFLISILDLYRYTQPYVKNQLIFTVKHGEYVISGSQYEETKKLLDEFIRDIQLRNELPSDLSPNGLLIQIVASATDYTKRISNGDSPTNLDFAQIRLMETKQLVEKAIDNHGLNKVVGTEGSIALVVEKGDGHKPKPSRQVIVVRGKLKNSDISKSRLEAYLKNRVQGRSRPNLLEYMYFSIYTITTTGYGDILPVSQQAKFIVSMENFVEVFFTVIFFGILIWSFSKKGRVRPE